MHLMHRLPRLVAALFLSAAVAAARAATPPQVGDTAPDFTLRTLDDRAVNLEQLTGRQRVVLIMLRGWPGYQCPLCTRQVNEFAARARDFDQRGAKVVMVYPGPAAQLAAHAQEFLQHKQWPANFIFLLDPNYAFTNAYGLRWDAPKETAYPSTFIVGRDGKVSFAKISKTHGGRSSVQAVLDALDAAK